MKKDLKTGILLAFVVFALSIPTIFIKNAINNIFKQKEASIQLIQKKLNDFYIPLDTLLTESRYEWMFLNKKIYGSYWITYKVDKQHINAKLQKHRKYKLNIKDTKVKLIHDKYKKINFYGKINILDEDNNFIGEGAYSQVFLYKKTLLKDSLKTGKFLYKIEVFFPHITLEPPKGDDPTIYGINVFFPDTTFKYVITDNEGKILPPIFSLPYFKKSFDHKISDIEMIKYIAPFYLEVNNMFLKNQIFILQSQDKNSYFLLNISAKKQNRWINYMLSVFKPYHEKMEKLILEKGYLVEDKKMKDLTQRLLFHIDGYKKVFRRWEKGDYSEMTSDINFPSEIDNYTKQRIKELERLLKNKQSQDNELF